MLLGHSLARQMRVYPNFRLPVKPKNVPSTRRPQSSAAMATGDSRAELCAYTLGLGDAEFRYQHVVDVLTAQEADAATPPMRLVFALVGLYLRVERGYNGRKVQRAHAALARQRPELPQVVLPARRAVLTAADVVAAAAGPARDAALDEWCAAVWATYGSCQAAVAAFARAQGLE